MAASRRWRPCLRLSASTHILLSECEYSRQMLAATTLSPSWRRSLMPLLSATIVAFNAASSFRRPSRTRRQQTAEWPLRPLAATISGGPSAAYSPVSGTTGEYRRVRCVSLTSETQDWRQGGIAARHKPPILVSLMAVKRRRRLHRHVSETRTEFSPPSI